MSVYETTDCMIHINSYFVNLRGSLDNLSWILQYERQVLPPITELAGPKRQGCYLFSKSFKKTLPAIDQDLADFLLMKEQWSSDFADLRDPAAHRVPITISRSVILTEDAKDKWDAIMNGLPAKVAAGEPASEIYAEADALARRLPIMILQSGNGKIEPRPLLGQLYHDHCEHNEISTRVFESLIATLS